MTDSTNDWLDLKEKLAAIEHERWADWQSYVHSKFVTRSDKAMKYRTVLPPSLVTRWDLQIVTPYSALTEREKQSDREQVDRYWHLIEALMDRVRISELNSLKTKKVKGANLVELKWVDDRIKALQAQAHKEAKGGDDNG